MEAGAAGRHLPRQPPGGEFALLSTQIVFLHKHLLRNALGLRGKLNQTLNPRFSVTRRFDRLLIASDDRFTTQLLAAQRRMAGYIHALIPNLVEAEEILQNSNAALLRKRAEAEAVENFPAWALRVVYFAVLAFRKQRAERGQAPIVAEGGNAQFSASPRASARGELFAEMGDGGDILR